MACTGRRAPRRCRARLASNLRRREPKATSRKGVTKSTPYHGYIYRLLKAQGPNATGGAYDYMVRDKMLGGFALIAFPAEYGSSGVMTFIVNHDGIVFSKDLGAETPKVVQAIDTFDPDKSWTREAVIE